MARPPEAAAMAVRAADLPIEQSGNQASPPNGSTVHEFGIASEIWQAVQRAAQQHGGRSPSTVLRVNKLLPNGAARVLSIAVEIGELNLIEDEQLRFWVTALAERDGSPGVELRIVHLPMTVRCEQCGDTRGVESREPGVEGGMFASPPLRQAGPCPRCGSSEAKVIGGREIRVVSAEVEDAAGS